MAHEPVRAAAGGRRREPGWRLLAALLLAAAPVSVAARIQTVDAAAPRLWGPPAAGVPDHAVTGVVQSVDATRLVITRAGKTPAQMSFALDAGTQRSGTIAAGVTVQVRYRGDGSARHATAIIVAPRHPSRPPPPTVPAP